MDIKKISSELKFQETHTDHLFEINGKQIRVFELRKMDSLFDDYDSTTEIHPDDKASLSDDELEALEEELTNL